MKARPRSRSWLLATAAALLALSLLPAQRNLVERGRYLASVGACSDCHTPHLNGEADSSRLLSGHPREESAPQWDPSLAARGADYAVSTTHTAFAGPWGTVFASNLTPDRRTGLGTWTWERFQRTMLRADYRFPMPEHFARFSREDLMALWAYLQSLPPVENRVPDFRPPR